MESHSKQFDCRQNNNKRNDLIKIKLVKMSAAFKLAKQKVSQKDLRKLMQEQKHSRNIESSKKINSPFAKYENGQLICVLCKKEVRSENVWNVHVNAKQHKENLAIAKQLKEKLEAKTTKPAPEDRLAGLKRSIEVMRSEIPEKKLKGILKNSSSQPTASTLVITSQPAQSNKTPDAEPANTSSGVPDDFFDSKPKSEPADSKHSDDKMEVDDEPIPEGFFDDPKKDAKARHHEYKDPSEEEWNRFQREIKEATVQSINIINEEHEEATVERQIDEIDAQIRNWSR